MQNSNYQKYINKQQVAKIIFDVLNNKISVATALSLFPKDNNDIDIKCAFDALLHREADEDLREKIEDYALVQDNYLKKMGEIFSRNEKLPTEIIAQYSAFHQDNLIPDKKYDLKTIFKKLKRMINF